MPERIRAIRAGIMKFWERFRRFDLTTQAAALAYHTLLGIVPIVAICFWYLAYLHVTDTWMRLTQGYILMHLNVAASSAFEHYFDSFIRHARGNSWGWVILAIFLYTVWSLIAKFGRSLDAILMLHPEQPLKEPRTWVLLQVRRAFALLALPVGLTISLIIRQWVSQNSWLHYLFQIRSLGPLLGVPLQCTTSILAVFIVYHFIPRHPVPWMESFRAALVVGPVSELVRFLFGLYNTYAVNVHRVYGVLAAIPLFILWVHVAWLILLSGAFLIRLPRMMRA